MGDGRAPGSAGASSTLRPASTHPLDAAARPIVHARPRRKAIRPSRRSPHDQGVRAQHWSAAGREGQSRHAQPFGCLFGCDAGFSFPAIIGFHTRQGGEVAVIHATVKPAKLKCGKSALESARVDATRRAISRSERRSTARAVSRVLLLRLTGRARSSGDGAARRSYNSR